MPLAAASLAQVHRGRLPDGREVAIKVQYPEIARLVAIDLRNFAFLVRVLARLEPDFDFRIIIDEVEKYVPLRARLRERGRERRPHAPAARRSPRRRRARRSCTSSRRTRLLVMDYVPGVRLTDVDGAPPARRRSEGSGAPPDRALLRSDPDPRLLPRRPASREHPRAARRPDGAARLRTREGPAARLLGRHRAARRRDRRRRHARPSPRAFRALGFKTRDRVRREPVVARRGLPRVDAPQQALLRRHPELVNLLNAEMPRIMRANPVVELPGDVLLIGRVLGLLSGVSKQLGSEVDVSALLVPYLGRVMMASTPTSAPPSERLPARDGRIDQMADRDGPPPSCRDAIRGPHSSCAGMIGNTRAAEQIARASTDARRCDRQRRVPDRRSWIDRARRRSASSTPRALRRSRSGARSPKVVRDAAVRPTVDRAASAPSTAPIRHEAAVRPHRCARALRLGRIRRASLSPCIPIRPRCREQLRCRRAPHRRLRALAVSPSRARGSRWGRA